MARKIGKLTAIQHGLENSDVVIGLVTQEALKSREVLIEWDYAFAGHTHLILLRYQDVHLAISGVLRGASLRLWN